MKELKKRSLNFEKSYAYLIDVVKDENSLGNAILENINYYDGEFYTLLPDDAALDRIYEFSFGGIILQEPQKIKQYTIGDTIKAWGIEVISIDNEFSNFLFEFLKKNHENKVLLDNYVGRVGDPHIHQKGIMTLMKGKEVYYLLSSSNSIEEISTMVKKYCFAWHALLVLTSNFNPVSQELLGEDFKLVCQNAQFVVIGAYDGEGYIFWEKMK